jgi:predicted ArsR family transcriptional regulator
MKKYIAVALLAAVSVVAAEKGEKKHGPTLTDEQKAIIAKYDTNKDGKLDKEERAKMTDEDKAKLPPPPKKKS